MGNIWLKIRIWTKVVLVTLVLIYVIVFAVKNSEPQATATFWYFFRIEPVTTSALKLVLFAFLSGAAVAVLARAAFRTVSQIRELKARQAAERREKELEELKAKAGMLRAKPATADAAATTDPPAGDAG